MDSVFVEFFHISFFDGVEGVFDDPAGAAVKLLDETSSVRCAGDAFPVKLVETYVVFPSLEVL